MFISDSEADSRLRRSENVLTVIDKESNHKNGVPHSVEPPSFDIPSIPGPPLSGELIGEVEEVASPETEEVDGRCQSAKDAGIPMALLRKLLDTKHPSGRREGQDNMAPEMRAACATTAQLVNTRTASREFDTSYHHADELKHGYTHQEARYDPTISPDKFLEQEINRQKKEVRDLAFEKLTKALGLISDDKLMAVTDPMKLSRISKDLSGVVDKVLPKESTTLGGVHFHVWRPEMRDEDSYEVVPVGGLSQR